MTPDEALALLDSVAAQAHTTRDNHARMLHAVEVLQRKIAEEPPRAVSER